MTPAPHRVLVTGATGFVGRALVPALAKAKWQVRAAARVPSAIPLHSGVEPVRLPDLTQPADWAALLADVSHIVHLAGIAHTGAAVPESTYARVNAEATAELARAANSAGVARFVLISSVRAQTGASATERLTESLPPQPTDAYGRSKLAAERAVAAGMPGAWTALRPVLVLGPGVKGNLAALSKLARSPLPLPFGALNNQRSLLGLSNLISIIEFALSHDAARNGTFLAADPEPLTVAGLLTLMRAACSRPPDLFSVPPPLLRIGLQATGRGGLAQSLLGGLSADVAKLTRAGWRPVSSTRDEIARMMGNPPDPAAFTAAPKG